MRGAFAPHLGFRLAVTDWGELLAALDGGVPPRSVRAWWLLDVLHLHLLMMDPEVRGPQVLLAALPFAHAVGGPFPKGQNSQANMRASPQWPCLSLLCASKLGAGKEAEHSQEETARARNWQTFAPSPGASPHDRKCDAESPGSRVVRYLTAASAWEIKEGTALKRQIEMKRPELCHQPRWRLRRRSTPPLYNLTCHGKACLWARDHTRKFLREENTFPVEPLSVWIQTQ